MLTMRKRLKLILFISLIMLSEVPCFAADTLNTNRNFVLVGLRYGIPAYNRLTIYSTVFNEGYYTVRSVNRSWYEFLLIDNYKKYSYSLGLSLIQSEFRGKDFKFGAHYLYQNINYNVYYVSVGFGRNFKLGAKHIIISTVCLYIPAVYDFKINNVYSKNSTRDTTIVPATKNAFNHDTNFGHFPRFKLGVSYHYMATKRLAIIGDLSFFYARSIGGKIPETSRPETVFNHSNNYSYLAYKVSQQMILIPSVGITYRLN